MHDHLSVPKVQRTVLVVDDQPAVCLSIVCYLELNGYKALKAESGAMAIEVARRERIDGALIDVHMPQLNGFNTCVRLRESLGGSGAKLKIWFMTGALTIDMHTKCRDVGGLLVIRKPFDWVELPAKFETAFTTDMLPSNSSM